jgi:hypothetical protein
MTVVNIKCTEESITLLVNHLKNKSGEFCVGNECDLSSKSLNANAIGNIEDNFISLTYEYNHYFDLDFDLEAVEDYFKDVLFKFDASKYIKKQDVIEIEVTEESECYDDDADLEYDEDYKCEEYSITSRYDRNLILIEEIDNYENLDDEDFNDEDDDDDDDDDDEDDEY